MRKIQDVQHTLRQMQLDGWLLYDFRRCNDLACAFLEIPSGQLLSRRFFYWIPKEGTPVKIVHKIESHSLEHLPGNTFKYVTWQDLDEILQQTLDRSRRIAMEYSPRNAIPYVSKVDAGTLEIVRSMGIEVVSSGDILQRYTAVWDEDQLKSHLEAAAILDNCAAKTWQMIADSLKAKKPLTEFDVQTFILEEFAANNCITADKPICAVNDHSADPHFSPSLENPRIIKPGDFILIDLWCKRDTPRAVFADITRVGVAADKPTEFQQSIFAIVRSAQSAATEFVAKCMKAGKALSGWEVDKVSREIIDNAGYGEYFTHRTGHNIGECDHGSGANIDNYETHDDRELLPGTCFSIEPGIYLPGKFGVRLEYDVYIHKDRAVEITGGVQEAIETLF